jgi:hypothetical protein
MDAHTLPAPTTAVIGMAFLSGARDGQHGFLPIFPVSLALEASLRNQIDAWRMTDRPFAASPGSV